MTIRSGPLFVALGIVAAAPAGAVVVDFTLTGTVAYIHDTTGEFGGAGAGDPFTLVFRADTRRGRFGAGGGGSGDGSGVFGGTKYVGTPDATLFPGITVSPLSAVLRIGGHVYRFASSYFGNADVFNDYNGVGQGEAGRSGGDLLAQGPVRRGSYSGSSTIDASFFSDHVLRLPLITAPFSLAFDGSHITSNIDFIQVLTGPATHQSIESEGGLTATTLVAGPIVVPEPASWALMVAGFAVTGGVLRQRRGPLLRQG